MPKDLSHPPDCLPFSFSLLELSDQGVSSLELEEPLTGKSVRLAIIDDGFHKDLWAFNRRSLPFDFRDDAPAHPHGTAVTAIVAGKKFDGFFKKCLKYPGGVAPGAEVTCFSITNENSVAQILRRVSEEENKFDVISMSLVYEGNDLDAIIEQNLDRGTLIFAGAGNVGNRGEIGYPARLKDVVSVGSLTCFGKPSDFTQDKEPYADVYTYGEVLVPSGIDLGGDGRVLLELQACKGTSMATPAAAGLACLAIEYAKRKGITNFKKLLPLFQRSKPPIRSKEINMIISA